MALVYLPVVFESLLPMLRDGYGDIAAASLTLTPEREKEVDFVVDNKWRVDEVVVAHKEVQGLEAINDLSWRRLYVLRGASFVEQRRALNKRLGADGRPPVIIEEAGCHLKIDDVLEMANVGVVDITIAPVFEKRGI